MIDTKHIRISDYNYPLPDERIAKFPIAQRDHSKLLIYQHGKVQEDIFYNLPIYLPEGALMVFNNTKVIQARMHFRKATGALIEVFLLEPYVPADYEQMFQTTARCEWICLVGNLKKWKEGALVRTVVLHGQEVEITATRMGEQGTGHRVVFEWHYTAPSATPAPSFAEIIDAAGELPIPPYLNRETQESDKTTYQTVYSKIKGSVAAPTAGLHFTDDVLKAVDERGIDREELTLHVGAGTFKPVKSEEIEGHSMHTEYYCVKRHTIEKLIRHQAQAIAVGTTSVRTLESLYYVGVKLEQYPDADAFVKNYKVPEQTWQRILLCADKKGIRRHPGALNKYADHIRNRYKSLMAQSLFDENAFYRVYVPYDNELQRALHAKQK